MAIYRDDVDRRTFERRLAVVEVRHGWIRRTLCLMSTHFHYLVETPLPNLSVGMHQLNSVYARWFNERHGRVGALLQRRFHSVLLETEEQLVAVHAYIAANPVRAGLCDHLEDWPWTWS
jgi:putative transposase